MARWKVHFADDGPVVIDCDEVAPIEGGGLVFGKTPQIQTSDLNKQKGLIPVAFVNLRNPNVAFVELVDAEQ